MKRSLVGVGSLLLGVALCVWSSPPAQADSIVNSKHNLSVSGPGTVKAQTEGEVCIFCHTPHSASPEAPLWNRASSGAVYTPYNSTTLDAAVGQPTGSSKLCLSCHDGTVALGAVLSRDTDIAMAPGMEFMPAGPTRLGTDLRDDHPISFYYDDALMSQDQQLAPPGSLAGAVKLDNTGQLQCRSCHDPHDNANGEFLVINNAQSALCITCHQRTGWDTCSHKLSSAAWNGTLPDPWPTTAEVTVAANACENCHQPHNAPSQARLLHAAVEEDVCFPCHNANVASKNVQSIFLKTSRHPIANTTAVHDPTEVAGAMPRHVECVDCHNPHAVRANAASPPNVPGPLEKVSGIDINGSAVNPAVYTYQICFKCHADTPDKPGSYLPRLFNTNNVRQEFSPTNASYHPVAAIGKNPDVPSLRSGWSTSSIISCTDCHNNDTGPGAGGSGPAGPHGSIYPPILERRYSFQDFVREDAPLYALCYKCHSRDNILRDNSFGEHKRHLEAADTPCSVCHDPHGVQSNTHLINFRLDIVSPNSQGTLEFVDLGRFQGACSLLCHGENHINRVYPR